MKQLMKSMGQGKYKVILGYLSGPENKEALKNLQINHKHKQPV
jgi:hypothetical protein